jgi:citrate lyase subunit beta/citryl-CoA lyase
MKAACAAGPDGIVVPKVNTAKEVARLVAAMERFGRRSTPSSGR